MKQSSSKATDTDPIFTEAGFRLFQDSIDPIIITDLAGNIVLANKRVSDLLNLSPEELVGLEIGHLHQTSNHLPDFTKLPDNSEEHFESVIQPSINSKPLYVKVHAHRYALENRDIVQWIHHDITRQIELDRLRDEQAAMLVHDLRSPLGNVISSLELILGQLDGHQDSTLYSMVDIAVRSSHYLKALIDSLLDISRLEAGRPLENLETVDIGSLVEFVSSVQAPEFEQRNVALLFKKGDSADSVLADANILRRILLNLVNNALRYSQPGQSITITADCVDSDNLIQFSVKDQGPGIPISYRELIFEKYQSVEGESPSAGLGLGLAFCQLAVNAHGGHIWVEDAPGGGACFSFTIPTADENE